MQYSIINYSNLEKNSIRFDPEYYHPQNLKLLKRLKSMPNQAIGEFSYVTDGIHESIQFDENSKINLISAKAPKENFFDLSGCGKISVSQDKKNPRTRLNKDDIIVSTVGTIGNCAVVDEIILPANSDRHVGIIRINKDFYPRFLSSFLLSKYGRFQTLRESTGNVQLNLFIYKIKEIITPSLSEKFQLLVENTCLKANDLNKYANNLYSKAEQILLSELDLLNWKPKRQLSFVKNYSDTQSALRIDAEYFQPMYKDIINCSKAKVETFLIDEVFTFKRGDFIDTKYYTNERTKRAYIRIKELSNLSSINEAQVIYIDDGFLDGSQNTLKEFDIVTAIIGDTIGKSNLILKEYDGSYFSNNTGRFRLRTDFKSKFDPFYLETLFHSIYIQSQIQRAKAQTGQPKIADSEIKKILIPCIDLGKQKRISQNIQKALDSNKISKQLLDIAKRGVEMAIEKDEKQAHNWINSELKNLNIK